MYKDILLAIDLDAMESSTKSVFVAVEYCNVFGARLHLMTVVPDFGMAIVGQYFPEGFEEKALQEARKRLHDVEKAMIPGGIKTQIVVGHGSIAQEILRVAGEISCDLIVMQSHRPGLQDLLIGPNAGKVVARAGCSVLVVRD